MGRRRANIIGATAALAVLLLIGGVAKAQPGGSGGRRMAPPHQGPMLHSNPRERWIAMPPEDRQIFRQNAERWMQMGPEERKTMREREKVYRAQVEREVDAALRESGLRLEGEKRTQFEQRYLQERRRIEHSLRQEIDSKRRQQLPALQERLKKEFQEPSPEAKSTSTPTGSSSPKK